MKYIITESQYNSLIEQKVYSPSMLSLLNTNPIFYELIKLNKKYLGLPDDSKITPEYTKKMNDVLSKKNVGSHQRTLMGSLINLIPVYEQGVDFNNFVEGMIKNNPAKWKGGLVGLNAPVSMKAMGELADFFNEKLQGKQQADYDEKKREEIVNMGQREKEELFKRYGMGGYDKWVKSGRPKL